MHAWVAGLGRGYMHIVVTHMRAASIAVWPAHTSALLTGRVVCQPITLGLSCVSSCEPQCHESCHVHCCEAIRTWVMSSQGGG
jgi:hypothetical protein